MFPSNPPTPTVPTVPVKIYLGESNVRRLRLPADAEVSTLITAVHTMVGTGTGTPAPTIKWEDSDGDYVTISTDEDLAEAISCLEPPTATLKVFINGVTTTTAAAAAAAIATTAVEETPLGSTISVVPPTQLAEEEGGQEQPELVRCHFDDAQYLLVEPPSPAAAAGTAAAEPEECKTPPAVIAAQNGHIDVVSDVVSDSNDTSDEDAAFPMPPASVAAAASENENENDPAAMASALLKSVFNAVEEGVKGIELAAKGIETQMAAAAAAATAAAGMPVGTKDWKQHGHGGHFKGKHGHGGAPFHGKHGHLKQQRQQHRMATSGTPQPQPQHPATVVTVGANGLLPDAPVGVDAEGPGVRAIQAALVYLGYFKPKFLRRHPGGVYGAKTVTKVLNFQKDFELEANGVFDHATLGKMLGLLDQKVGSHVELRRLCSEPTATPASTKHLHGHYGKHGKHSKHSKHSKHGKGGYLAEVAREFRGVAPVVAANAAVAAPPSTPSTPSTLYAGAGRPRLTDARNPDGSLVKSPTPSPATLYAGRGRPRLTDTRNPDGSLVKSPTPSPAKPTAPSAPAPVPATPAAAVAAVAAEEEPVPPTTLYAEQLQTLRDMGFGGENELLMNEMLGQANGSVSDVVAILLG